jgi:hypothetical protein
MSTRTRFTARWGACFALIVLAGLFGLPTSAWAGDFTWSGAGASRGPFDSGNWSEGSNWSGGAAPSGLVGALTFPQLGGCGGGKACYTSFDDVSGLIVNSMSVQGPYLFPGETGTPLTLGAGGLTVRASKNKKDVKPEIAPAIKLSAPQTWSLVGGNFSQGATVASVTGESEPLAIKFSHPQTFSVRGHSIVEAIPLDLAADVEVGVIRVSGPGALAGAGRAVSLNASDGNPVNLTQDATLAAPGTGSAPLSGLSTGPVSSTGGHIVIDSPLSVNGDLSLDPRSSVESVIYRAGTKSGKDYAQLRAGGAVSLGGSDLRIEGPLNRYCAELQRGDTYTLITTTGSLSGTFRSWNPFKRAFFNVSNGRTVPVGCEGADEMWSFQHAPRVRIRYTSSAVTATVVRVWHRR